MGWAVNCECGDIVRADDEAGVIEGVEQHVSEKHPDLLGKLTENQILAMAERI